MGVVKRQGFWNSLITYAGICIGMLNNLLLYPVVFGPDDELGLIKLLPYLALVYTQFSSLGIPGVVIRFFPFFNEKERQHHGFLVMILLAGFLGFLFVGLLYVLLKPLMILWFEERSALLIDYYYALIPLSFFVLYNTIFESYLGALYKSVVPSLVRELVIPLTNTLAILVFWMGWVGFAGFVLLFVGLYVVGTLLLIAYLVYLGQFHLGLHLSFRIRKLWPRMLSQGIYSMLTSMSSIFYQVIDGLMLAGYLGLTAPGIYLTLVPILKFMMVPAKSMYKVVYPLIGQHAKNRAWQEIEILYKKASLVGLVFGGFIFMGIVINLHLLFAPPFPLEGFEAGRDAIIILGIGRLFDLITSTNNIIIISSRYYRYTTLFMSMMLVVAPIANMLLIPRFGITGAALATAFTGIFVNFLQLGFVWNKFGMLPFTWRSFFVLSIIGLVSWVGMSLPKIDFWLWDSIYRSFVCSILYWGILLGLRISPDIEGYLMGIKIKRWNR
ncbi:MAG: polysaccharide biosynthesis C-terminal domain-containing protein [Bacteroidota bacterium]